MSKKVPAYAKQFKDHKVIVFHENGSITHYDVWSMDSDIIETEEHVFKTNDAFKVYDNTNGGFTYIFNCPEVALVEAEKLKLLRRSMAIKNIFSYDREKGINFMQVLPYLVAIAAVVFSG
jgi:hypothetical protein